MTRVLNRFYIAKAIKTSDKCWGVFEHNNKLNNTVKLDLTYDEAIEFADKRNKEYDKALCR